jgi:hypothetical protein
VPKMGSFGAILSKAWELPTDRTPTEQEEQQDFIRWFRRTYPTVRIFAVANGEKRSKRDGGRLKAAGVSPGVPDLCVPAWSIWVEMKARGGSVSPAQRDWHEYLRGIGHTVLVPMGSAEAQRMVTSANPSTTSQ